MALTFATYMVPSDVDAEILEWQRRAASERGIELKEFSKAGEALRDILAHAKAARALNVKPALQPEQAQA